MPKHVSRVYITCSQCVIATIIHVKEPRVSHVLVTPIIHVNKQRVFHLLMSPILQVNKPRVFQVLMPRDSQIVLGKFHEN